MHCHHVTGGTVREGGCGFYSYYNEPVVCTIGWVLSSVVSGASHCWYTEKICRRHVTSNNNDNNNNEDGGSMCCACAVHVLYMYSACTVLILLKLMYMCTYVHCTCIFVIIILKIMHAVLVHNDINLYNLF